MADVLNPNSTIRKHADVLDTELDGEIVLMSVETGKYYGLDATGSAIWRHLAEPVALTALVAALADEFEADRESLERDVRDFIGTLAERQLIEIAP